MQEGNDCPSVYDVAELTQDGAKFWLAMDAWTIDEALNLLCAIDPRVLNRWAELNSGRAAVGFPAHFESLGALLQRAAETGVMPFPAQPTTVLEWAMQKKMRLPEHLIPPGAKVERGEWNPSPSRAHAHLSRPAGAIPRLGRDEKKRLIEFVLKRKFPFSWAPPPITPLRGGGPRDLHSGERHRELMDRIEAERKHLWNLPEPELLGLQAEANAKDKAKRDAEHAALDAAINAPETEADYDFWTKAEYWSFAEAVALLLGKDPKKLPLLLHAAQMKGTPFAHRYNRLQELAKRAAAMNGGPRLAPASVILWANSIGAVEEIPPGLHPVLDRLRTPPKPMHAAVAVPSAPAPAQSRAEAGGGTSSPPPASGGIDASREKVRVPAPAPSAAPQVHSTKPKRRDTLSPVIETAQAKCRNPKDVAEVWGLLLRAAEAKEGPLLGVTVEGIQYLDEKRGADFLSKEALRKRIGRAGNCGR